MMNQPETLELNSVTGHPEDRLIATLTENLQVVALEHKHCGWAPTGYQFCPVPDISDLYTRRAYDELIAAWGATAEVFMDTLCVHLQTRDLRNHAVWHTRPGEEPDAAMLRWADSRIRRDKLIVLLDEVLRPHGYHVTAAGEVVLIGHAGTRAEIEGPSLEALDRVGWTEVSAKMGEAIDEVQKGNFGDAVTDVGTGLQWAFTRAGHDGKTLGEQIKAAGGKSMAAKRGSAQDASDRADATFAGVHTRLGDVAYHLSEWLSAVRNQISDAHHGPDASQTEAELAVRTGLALAAWLADNSQPSLE